MVRAGRRPWGIAGRVLALQVALVTVLVAAVTVGGVLLAHDQAEATAERTVVGVARTVAATPEVVAAVTTTDPTDVLQSLAERVRTSTGVSFVVVMSTTGIRWSHPDTSLIGGHFQGHIATAVAGGTEVETYTGSLGPSVRSVVPVRAGDRVVALVSVGIPTASIGTDVSRRIPVIVVAALAALALAVFGSWLIGRTVRRQTLGLGAPALARMAQSQEAVLHSIREGLVVVDGDGVLRLANDEALRLLGLEAADIGRPVADIDVAGTVGELLRTGRTAEDESHTAAGRVLLVSQAEARAGRHTGRVVTLRDRTELLAVSGERDRWQGFADSLRAVAHESANRLHTVVSLVELGRTAEAVRLATGQMAASQQLADRLVDAADDEPELVALLLAKSAQASERGVAFDLDGARVTRPTGVDPDDLLVVIGNLVDNALDAATTRVEVVVDDAEPGVLRIAVSDDGGGMSDPDRAFERGWSSKTDAPVHGRGLGLALVEQVVQRRGGRIHVDTCAGDGTCVEVELPVVPDRVGS
ncbi:sensor histidine kinase [Jatrophihabitans sp. YIM 134969]